MNSGSHNEERGVSKSDAKRLRPHIVQVVAIFRMLGIGYRKENLTKNQKFSKSIHPHVSNNLVQVSTGEGKSVVLAATACILALLGCEVDVACYSDYLSTRDYNDFWGLFREFGVDKMIKYSTFDLLCEALVHRYCNVRQVISTTILQNLPSLSDLPHQNKKCDCIKVMLVDEADVLLSETFFGGIYSPATFITHPTIIKLLDYIWNSKLKSSGNNYYSKEKLQTIKLTQQYKDCAAVFSNWMDIIDEQIKDMLAAIRTFATFTVPYIVKDDLIKYSDGENYSSKIRYGFNTVWTYYNHHKIGDITISSFEKNVGITLNCGTFSYAEMPLEYDFITGVTGTLKTLAKKETDILSNIYNIQAYTYMPSVFGRSNRTFRADYDVLAIEDDNHWIEVWDNIKIETNNKRPVLVFFENDEALEKFHKLHDQGNIKIITEKIDKRERDLLIKQASTEGRITLLTRSFGRGTDFICRSPVVLANGGVHVLQTFFSKEISEEVQIMGRSARQGEKGSFQIIIANSNLEWVLGPSFKEELNKIKNENLYEVLSNKRSIHYESICESKDLGITQRKEEHRSSLLFIEKLLELDTNYFRNYLVNLNKGADLTSNTKKTMILMDATYSMHQIIEATKQTICLMYERAKSILVDSKKREDSFEVKFVAYRNYSSGPGQILQASEWEVDPKKLRDFILPIDSSGGQGNEAIEVALSYVKREDDLLFENANANVSQVILIGDMPPNTKQEVSYKRNDYGNWNGTLYSTPVYWEDEVQQLANKNIPIHACYVYESAMDTFKEISRRTNGMAKSLPMHNPATAAIELTNLVSMQILESIGGKELVDLYVQKYIIKSHV